ncbi:MAG: epoxide hydrolase [Gammaproteobacteria bacterium]|jgi:microsomal epoxide hydrolase|nr:epoxide hydrolase [Gammaproteobacteria bacterium]MDG2337288.1 epoxide hydrolase [Gammaproteobacteria bacterium]
MRSRLSDLPFKRIGLLSLAILLCSLAFAKPDLLTRKPDTLANSQPMPNETSMPEAKLANNAPILPFEIQVSDAAIEDLQRRLAATRMPDQLRQTSWEYGTDSSYLAELLSYWRNDFDWREQESQLNQFDQFKTEIDGLDMHFIHQRSENPNAIPLMVVHGWPGSVAEFTKIIGPLTDPVAHGGNSTDSYHVIAPSLPGFGFSEKPNQPGYSPEKFAHMLAALMERLGYEQYAIAGGDWGAIINRYLANNYPDRLIGLHSNMVLANPPADETVRNNVSEAESTLREARTAYMQNEVGYQQIQRTKPQSLGYGLNDSPAGLAAWIVEKFHGWSDMPQGADGYLDNHFTKDELLTNISIYWYTETITSSARIYYENSKTPVAKPIEYIDVPTGAAVYPAEIYITPKSWVEAAYDLRHYTLMDQGGHFAALEQPESYINELNTFFRLLR